MGIEPVEALRKDDPISMLVLDMTVFQSEASSRVGWDLSKM
jgi:hypothetical protein